MKDEYVILNKTNLEKVYKSLKQQREVEPDNYTQSYLNGKIKQLNEVLSQSTPLIPEIEKAWEHGYTRGYNLACCESVNSDCLTPNKQDYISNLKLNI